MEREYEVIVEEIGWRWQLEEWCAKKKPRVRERILRLNPKFNPGTMLRGWHPTDEWHIRAAGFVTKGELIRKHGRKAWEGMPRHLIRKRGRRCYIRIEDMQNEVWKPKKPLFEWLDGADWPKGRDWTA